MLKKMRYRQQAFTYSFVALFLFTAGIITLQWLQERYLKKETHERILDSYVAEINRYVITKKLDINTNDLRKLSEIVVILPANLRLTIIDLDGKIVYDNKAAHPEIFNISTELPEMQYAIINGTSSGTQKSDATGVTYFYYAKSYDNYFIRASIPYNMLAKRPFRSNNTFIYLTIILSFVILLLFLYLSRKLSNPITELRDFIYTIQNDKPTGYISLNFPNNELGDIAGQIARNHQQLTNAKEQLAIEKKRMEQCFYNSNEGIGVFSATQEPIFLNTRFVTYVNILLNDNVNITKHLFNTEEFAGIKAFLSSERFSEQQIYHGKMSKENTHFSVKCVVFQDLSFELILNDISETESMRALKQELTNNIAHELRTPVSSIRGYAETILKQGNIDPKRCKSFIERIYEQSLKLSELVRDISLITKMEETPSMFIDEDVNILSLLQELKEEFEDELRKHSIKYVLNIPSRLTVHGNKTLLYSLFRNLIENVIHYAGEGVTIFIDNHETTKNYYFFSFLDTGKGVSEEHISKLFDRFFRIDEDRNSYQEGTGLGLAIVKNAVEYHNGEIVAKNRKDGGLEFLFTLEREPK